MKSKKKIVLIGAGIMSATLGILLKKLDPSLEINIYERLPSGGMESSDAWNNAGTGHSAFCELNYTPELEDGTIETSKAIKIAESFEESKQFWSFLVSEGIIEDPSLFITRVPHFSFVTGEKNVRYLQKRHEALSKNILFKDMVYLDDRSKITELLPIMMEGRSKTEKVAATCMNIGTDVNFGALTLNFLKALDRMDGVQIFYNHEVQDLDKNGSNWDLTIKSLQESRSFQENADFVFIGAGGRALTLLEKSGIEEAKGFGGFPVSGQWLTCKNRNLIEKHHSKVYGKPAIGAPPMSVPHLDTRNINGKRELLFGPFAGFSTKFLKTGSYLDLPKSIQTNNILPMLAAGFHNIPLTRYLIGQVTQSMHARMEALREFCPLAKEEDWELKVAGMRVQVIKKDPKETGVLEFGTEVVSAADGSVAALLGASPGASTAVSIMLELVKKCFKEQWNTSLWQQKIHQMVPTFQSEMQKDDRLRMMYRQRTSQLLQLQD